MKVLLISDIVSKIGGGSQQVIFTWVKNLKKKGIQVKVLCNQDISKYDSEISPEDLIINKGINLGFIMPHLSIAPWLYDEAIKQIDEFEPDIVHLHEPSLIAYQMMDIAQNSNIKTMVSFHTNCNKFKVNTFPHKLVMKENGLINKLIDTLQMTLMQNADIVTVPTKTFKRIITKKVGKKVNFLHYPVNSHFYTHTRSHSSTPTKLISISRLSGEKNIHLLIEIMQHLNDSFSLTIVGDGIERKHLEKKVEELHLTNKVHFTGWLEQTKMVDLIQQHDLFLSMSDFETFGLTYIESLACRVPAVVFDYSVSREIFPKGTAVFIDSTNPEIWARRIENLQHNPQEFKILCKNIDKQYKSIYAFHEEESTKELINLYTVLLNKRIV